MDSRPPHLKNQGKAINKELHRAYAVESSSPPPQTPQSTDGTINNNSVNRVNENFQPEFYRTESDDHLSSDPREELTLKRFLVDTMTRSAKDRQFVIRIENNLLSLLEDHNLQDCKLTFTFESMTSYQRLLVHRVAEYHGFDHNVHLSGHMVEVHRKINTRMNDILLRNLLQVKQLEPKKSILKRESASFDETTTKPSELGVSGDGLQRSKSFEEREFEYEKARKRIFDKKNTNCEHHFPNGDHQNSQVGYNSEDQQHLSRGRLTGTMPSYTATDTSQLNAKALARENSRLKKGQSYESNKDMLQANSMRPTMSKSNSFGGYDQCNVDQTNRVAESLSGASSQSPLSSGYKSQSMQSDTFSATPSPSVTPHPPVNALQPAQRNTPAESGKQLLWAVSSMESIPPGSLLIDPETGYPYINIDGTPYHFDPNNPPFPEDDGRVGCGMESCVYKPRPKRAITKRNCQPCHTTNEVMNPPFQPTPPHRQLTPNTLVVQNGMMHQYPYSQDRNIQEMSGSMMGLNINNHVTEEQAQPPFYRFNFPTAATTPQTVLYSPLSSSPVLPRVPAFHNPVYEQTRGTMVPLMYSSAAPISATLPQAPYPPRTDQNLQPPAHELPPPFSWMKPKPYTLHHLMNEPAGKFNLIGTWVPIRGDHQSPFPPPQFPAVTPPPPVTMPVPIPPLMRIPSTQQHINQNPNTQYHQYKSPMQVLPPYQPANHAFPQGVTFQRTFW